MTVNTSRSQRAGLLEGATDGRYRKVRPDTEVSPMTGGERTMQTRSQLHAWYNYGEITQEIPADQRVVPGT